MAGLSPNDCTSPYIFYRCQKGFIGCCSVDPCDDTCPSDKQQPEAAVGFPSDTSTTFASSMTALTPTTRAMPKTTSASSSALSTSSTITSTASSHDTAATQTSTYSVSIVAADTTNSAAPTATANSGSSAIPFGAIIGLTIGIVLLIGCAGFLAFILWRRRSRKHHAASASEATSPRTLKDEKDGYTPIVGQPNNSEDCFTEFGGNASASPTSP
jgi:hypothetical protein